MQYLLETLIPVKHLARMAQQSEQKTIANPIPCTYYKCQALCPQEKTLGQLKCNTFSTCVLRALFSQVTNFIFPAPALQLCARK